MEKQTNKEIDYFSNIKKNFLIRLIMVTGVMIFILIKSQSMTIGKFDKDFFVTFISIINPLAVGIVLFGLRFKRKREKTYKTGELKERLQNFLLASKYQFSTLEACVIFLGIGYLLFDQLFLLAESLICYVWLILIFPTKMRLKKQIQIT